MAISSTIASRPFLTSSRRIGSLRSRALIAASGGDDDVAVSVQAGGAARRDQRGGVVLVDEQRPGPGRRIERRPRDDRRRDLAMGGSEVGAAVAAAARAIFLEPDRGAVGRAQHARGEPQVHHLDGIALRLVAVGPLVLEAEAGGQLAQGLVGPGRRQRHRQLEGLSPGT